MKNTNKNKNTNLTIDQIDNNAIRALRLEARMHGDEAMVFVCDSALRGNERARLLCLETINDARAQM